jgi:L-lactate utilization protein LutB
MQANEYAKERDALTTQTELLRSQLQEAQSEIALARRSVAEEKQNYESRLDEERKAKERARAQLDSRMDEVARKKSKFACM